MEKKFYRPEEVAFLLGFSVRTVWRWIRSERISHVHINKAVRVPREEIERITKGGMVTKGN